MQRFRTVLFWSHLVVALIAGTVVVIMSATGVALALRPQILERAERLEAAPRAEGGVRLSLDDLLARVRTHNPGTPPASIIIDKDPTAFVRVALGRQDAVLVDPYSGDIHPLPGAGWRNAFHLLLDWHRALGAEGERRAFGQAATGACNAGFLFLAISGLCLWWPRKWTRSAARMTLWFRQGLRGNGRDLNWHNVIGFWTLPALVVIATSGLTISYRWASNLIFTLNGEPPPAQPEPLTVPSVAGAKWVPMETLFVLANREVPSWQRLTIQLRQLRARSGPRVRTPEQTKGTPITSVMVQEAQPWPLFSTVQLSFHPYSGALLRKESYGDQPRGRRMRSWLRFLHTGEALGLPGQMAAGVASIGALFLAWTGGAMAWRRHRRHRARATLGA